MTTHPVALLPLSRATFVIFLLVARFALPANTDGSEASWLLPKKKNENYQRARFIPKEHTKLIKSGVDQSSAAAPAIKSSDSASSPSIDFSPTSSPLSNDMMIEPTESQEASSMYHFSEEHYVSWSSHDVVASWDSPSWSSHESRRHKRKSFSSPSDDSESPIPSVSPSSSPSVHPDKQPPFAVTSSPTWQTTEIASQNPTAISSVALSDSPSASPSLAGPTRKPSPFPTPKPSLVGPTPKPSPFPNPEPSPKPSPAPSGRPSVILLTTPTPSITTTTAMPSALPTRAPSTSPTKVKGTKAPSLAPTTQPSRPPSTISNDMPSDTPSDMPSDMPSFVPSASPTKSCKKSKKKSMMDMKRGRRILSKCPDDEDTDERRFLRNNKYPRRQLL